jgi:diguanylate cyclase (GGDEF)-like protein
VRAHPSARPFQHLFVARGLLVVSGLLLATLWGFVIFVLDAERNRLLRESRLESQQLGVAVASHAEALLEAVETDLHIVDLWLFDHPEVDPRTDASFVRLVDQLRKDSDGLIDLVLISDEGKLYPVPTRPDSPIIDVRDRPHFTVHLEGGRRRLYLGEPVFGRARKTWLLPVTWKLERPVAGITIISAVLEFAKVFDVFRDLGKGSDTTVILVRHDGLLLSRVPFDPAQMERSPQAVAASDEDLVTERTVGDYPVKVVVKHRMSDVLAHYRRTRAWLVSASALFSAIVVGMTLLLHRAIRARQSAQEQLEQLATHDGLTGLLNRRAFFHAAAAEVARSLRYGRPALVLVMDLDHFKRINDTFGHAAGDEVLRRFAETLRTMLREQDVVGRLGGEEFAALLPETADADGRSVAERIREKVASLSFGTSDQAFTVTVSIGLTTLVPSDHEVERAVERADQALYLAKERGRNRVEAAEATLPRSA